MYSRRKHNVAAARFQDRRKREDEAPRLTAEAPDVTSLKLTMEERSADVALEPAHIRRVIVERAPALFLIPCGDARCTDGGHDITRAIMRALRNHETTFEDSDACSGSTGTSPCTRVLHVSGVAEYR